MFDNLDTALVQAFGFFAVFGFFVYQTIFANKESNVFQKDKFETGKSDTKKSNEKFLKKVFLFRNFEPIQEDVVIKKKGLLNKKSKTLQEEIKPNKRFWFKEFCNIIFI